VNPEKGILDLAPKVPSEKALTTQRPGGPPGHTVRGISFSTLINDLVLDLEVNRDELRTIVNGKKITMKISPKWKMGLRAIMRKTLEVWDRRIEIDLIILYIHMTQSTLLLPILSTYQSHGTGRFVPCRS
jgi:hypothetical protein